MDNLKVAFVWHFHQPLYSKPDDNVLPLPWVRLHAIKDYLDMLKYIQKFPSLHATFNFTPSLLLQIQDYQKNSVTDRQFLLFKKKAEELTVEERIEILRDFFLANWETMIEPFPRYLSLLLKRGKNIVEDELPAIAQNFTVSEIRDLQIWANLTWIDPMFRGEINDLYQKGKNFKETDKNRIIALEDKIINSIFDEYKKASGAGEIEISTSPLYHPILPLLIDNKIVKLSNPNLAVPFEFMHPDDAFHQIQEGIKIFEQIFGFRPKGLWPPEGGVSKELMKILSSLGIEWIATDEEILARGINKSFRRDENSVPNRAELLYRPWQFERINILFRDHTLSDLIGFVYCGWEQVRAADDLIERIKNIGNALPSIENFIIPIILDGENAWEFYKNDGKEFFESLYGGFTKEGIQTTTISEFLSGYKTQNILTKLFPGSWINGNFNIWIGDPAHQKAWQIVKNLRDTLVAKNIQAPEIWNRFYVLEGSDWFWWFSEEHFSMNIEFYDELFRLNAIWIYKKIDEEPPPELFSPIKKRYESFSYQAIDKLTPTVDGRISHFYEWYNAGYADIKRLGGTMHRFAGLFSLVYFGFDENNFYIRFDIKNHEASAYDYSIRFYKPEELLINLNDLDSIRYKIEQIGEVAIPISLFSTNEPKFVEFILYAHNKGIEIDRTPLLRFSCWLKDTLLYNWTV